MVPYIGTYGMPCRQDDTQLAGIRDGLQVVSTRIPTMGESHLRSRQSRRFRLHPSIPTGAHTPQAPGSFEYNRLTPLGGPCWMVGFSVILIGLVFMREE